MIGSPVLVLDVQLVHRFASDELILVPAHAALTDQMRCVELISERVIAS